MFCRLGVVVQMIFPPPPHPPKDVPGTPTTIYPGALVAYTQYTCRQTRYCRLEIFRAPKSAEPQVTAKSAYRSIRRWFMTVFFCCCGGASLPLPAASGRRQCGSMQVARWIGAVPWHLIPHIYMPVVGSNRV